MNNRLLYFYNKIDPSNKCFRDICEECVYGACCFPDGTCSDDFSESGCDYYSGTFYPNKKCSDPDVICETPTPTPTLYYPFLS